MTVPEFAGPALRLTDADIAAAARSLGVEPALVAAVAEVESAGDGFLDDGRPKILFERHIFSRETAHRFDDSHSDISNPSRGGYGAAGANQFDRLHRAIVLDRRAALRSASWGKFQVMGFNAEVCGWWGVEAFVASMVEGEAQHLKAFIGFCQANDLVRHLVVHDWRKFTAGYNGTGQVDHYSALLAAAYERHAAAAALQSPPAPVTAPVATVPPFDAIKALQTTLRDAGYYRGPIDGLWGPRSRNALGDLLAAAGQARV